METEPEPEPEPEVAAIADAGAPDATAIAELADAGVGPADAGAAVAEAADAGPAPTDGGTRIATAARDGGVAADGGTRVAAADLADGGAGSARTPSTDPGMSGTPAGDPNAPPAPTGAGANLLAYFPQGEQVAVIVRLDRFRGTPWAARLEKIFQPMPDYDALMGQRKTTMAELFDTLVIASPRPQDATATTVVVRYPQKPRTMRSFLSNKNVRVKWRQARGGALGTRLPSKVISRNDRRVYLMPTPQLVMLARPQLLGGMSAPARGKLGSYPAADKLPDWIQRVQAIERETGDDQGPSVVATITGVTKTLRLPVVGELAGPDRATVALEIHKKGFIVRGNLLFDSPARASGFVKRAHEIKKQFTESLAGKAALTLFKAYNAVKGLTLNQAGAKVAFATSISIGDAQAMVDRAAVAVEGYFQRAAERAAEDDGAK
jgi:hypothetical protein